MARPSILSGFHDPISTRPGLSVRDINRTLLRGTQQIYAICTLDGLTTIHRIVRARTMDGAMQGLIPGNHRWAEIRQVWVE